MLNRTTYVGITLCSIPTDSYILQTTHDCHMLSCLLGCRCLVATHYQQLGSMAGHIPSVGSYKVVAEQDSNGLIMSYQIKVVFCMLVIEPLVQYTYVRMCVGWYSRTFVWYWSGTTCRNTKWGHQQSKGEFIVSTSSVIQVRFKKNLFVAGVGSELLTGAKITSV